MNNENIAKREELIIDIKLLFDIDLSICNHNTFMHHINKYLSARRYTDIHNDVVSYIVRLLEDDGKVYINIDIPTKLSNVTECIVDCVKSILMCNNIPYSDIYNNYESNCKYKDKLKPEGKLFGYTKYTMNIITPVISTTSMNPFIFNKIYYEAKVILLGIITEKEGE